MDIRGAVLMWPILGIPRKSLSPLDTILTRRRKYDRLQEASAECKDWAEGSHGGEVPQISSISELV